MAAPFRKASKLVRGEASGAAELNETIWALRDVSFEINRGEVVGIIGRNGAGKSTLLKVLSRITEPTAGFAEIHGRLGSLLEVGTGFNLELTGRENVYLNGAILGMKWAEIGRKFDEIVGFAELEKFIDTPVKHYSSGMYLRLAFAVAAYLEPEILLVDEVLAVGDAAFQKKCLGKIGEVASKGRTVLFVSHNMGAIRSLCERVILLQEGKIWFDGEPPDAISTYLCSEKTDQSGEDGQICWIGRDVNPPGCEEIWLRAIVLKGPSGVAQSVFEPDKPIQVEICYEVRRRLRGARFNLHVLTQEGESAFSGTDSEFREEIEFPGFYRSTCIIPAGLMNRRVYTIEISCFIPCVKLLVPRKPYLRFTVSGAGNQSSYHTSEEIWPGVVCPRLEWKVEKIEEIGDFYQSECVRAK
jgi:lipopolysaccharide transport system ATP-binding protein